MKKIIKIEKVNVISKNLDTVQVKKRISVFNKIAISYCMGWHWLDFYQNKESKCYQQKIN
ncbi:hypothetical protein [Tenacibaculum finnmarkense]|uniref:Uncharacterized protein n=1 Tax=Tenacibaculum finnmarkense genomovar finnmarkense TaxID=1458503 RepID=A0AAP1RGP1_9FLAO|nr:hypothetical protein [Tenacibaculum finnmarkense]MBE7653528.1 hypothetical protein [Tenacibaculum finnmarkense genomovar finnmarkense]MBE7695880.1 hypothetical protein [Tenacibaculum finnmarkense genomovar finnmarkense]MCD8428448.1 hypothetical protein [Tenacibaculum finnmarkense genomovar finnmarkense]MCG8731744.1 hypothetical protein [Tenacibaculum finnmarkense]MCG8751755.1 hypothetical protein [Tenacibaculum finnmarkense]